MFILHRYTHTYITKHPTNYSLGAERFNLKLCSSTLEPTRGVFLMKWELISPLLPQREAKIEAAVRHLILTMSIWPYNFWQLGSVERNTYRVGRCVGSFTILQTEKKIRSQWSMILPSNQSCRCKKLTAGAGGETLHRLWELFLPLLCKMHLDRL